MKCKDCKAEGCPFRCYTEEGECSYDDISVNNFDWQSFRAEAAKDILCSIIQGGYAESRIEYQSKLAVKYADELIKHLKE